MRFNYSIRWGKVHGEIFTDLVENLNQNQVRYFILRNYEGLPEKNISKDVDIIIEPGSYSTAVKILRNIFKKKRISNYHSVKYERVNCWYGIDIKQGFSIHIDLIEGYLSKGFELFTFNELYDNTELYKNFRVLNASYNAVMLLFYKIIGTKKLNNRYQKEISLANIECADKIGSIIKSSLGGKLGNQIISYLNNSNYEAIINLGGLISRESKKNIFLKKPIKSIFNVTRFLAEKVYRIIVCPRRYQNFIAVEGPDGTGKTTFIESLSEAIGYYYVSDINKSHVYHFRPTILPNLGKIGEKFGISEQDKNFSKPHRALPSGRINSFFRMFYYWLDYLIGVPIKLRKDVQFDRFTIYDRYIYDFLIDPKRSRINLPYWLRKIFTRLVVQPRIVFVLLTDAETIYQRKQELSTDEIKRQLTELKKLAASHDRFVILDASKRPEELVDEAIRIVINKFTQKVA